MNMESINLVTDFLNEHNIEFKIKSTKNDLDIVCYDLLINKTLRSRLIDKFKQNNLQLITFIIPDISGRIIFYFFDKINLTEFVLDISYPTKAVYSNFLLYYFQFNKLFKNIFFVGHDEFNRVSQNFKNTLFPFKYLQYKNLFSIFYFSMRGCLVVVKTKHFSNTFKI